METVCVFCDSVLKLCRTHPTPRYVCNCKDKITFADVLDEIAKLPENIRVEIKQEEADDDDPDFAGERFMWISLWEDPPEDGWESEGDRFGHPPGSPSHSRPVRLNERFDSRIIVSTGSGMDADKSARLALHMIKDQVARLKSKE